MRKIIACGLILATLSSVGSACLAYNEAFNDYSDYVPNSMEECEPVGDKDNDLPENFDVYNNYSPKSTPDEKLSRILDTVVFIGEKVRDACGNGIAFYNTYNNLCAAINNGQFDRVEEYLKQITNEVLNIYKNAEACATCANFGCVTQDVKDIQNFLKVRGDYVNAIRLENWYTSLWESFASEAAEIVSGECIECLLAIESIEIALYGTSDLFTRIDIELDFSRWKDIRGDEKEYLNQLKPNIRLDESVKRLRNDLSDLANEYSNLHNDNVWLCSNEFRQLLK